MPPDALDLIDVPSLIAVLIGGVAFGAVIIARDPHRTPFYTSYIGVSFAVVFFTFLVVVRAYTSAPHWGRTIGTAFECVVFGYGMGAGVALRRVVRVHR